MKAVYAILPTTLAQPLQALPAAIQNSLEEIRIRIGRPLEIGTSRGFAFLAADGQLREDPAQALVPSVAEGRLLLGRLSQHSLYAWEEELQQGFLTLPGGHRVGLAGRMIPTGTLTHRLRDIASFNLRIARPKVDVGRLLLPYLLHEGGLQSTLLLAPPQAGKTTLLRDLTRLLSCGGAAQAAQKVAVIDERSEIAGCCAGIPHHDVGPRTDVLDGCPKVVGMMMAIRSLSPHVVVVDEIGHAGDATALEEAAQAGVALLATAHADTYEAYRRRPALAALARKKLFQRVVLLSRRQGPGTVEAIYDAAGQTLGGDFPCGSK